MFNDIIERNMAFGHAVERELAKEGADKLPRRVIFRRAIEGGAPRFYVSYSRAKRMLACDGSNIPEMGSGAAGYRRRRMWSDFKACVDRHIAASRFNNREMAILLTLSCDPAPSFYIGIRQGMKIYNEYLRQKAFEERSRA